MVTAARIESGVAGRAFVSAGHILLDAHFISTGAAEHGKLSPFGLRPNFDRMVCQLIVAILAGIVDAATLHFDRDDVEVGSIVSA